MKSISLFLACICFVSSATAAVFNDRVALNELIYKVRDPGTDSKCFRKSLEKIGEYMALEVLEDLATKEVEIQTLTNGIAKHRVLAETPVLVTVLRAGLPLYFGVQKVFEDSDSGFLAMSRNEETLKAKTEYIGLPDLKDKCVILVDTMIATGGSILDSIKIIEKYKPARIIVLGAIAAKSGIQRITDYDSSIKVYAASIDPDLNECGYIVPGLGDAGDRCYGCKCFVSSASNHQK